MAKVGARSLRAQEAMNDDGQTPATGQDAETSHPAEQQEATGSEPVGERATEDAGHSLEAMARRTALGAEFLGTFFLVFFIAMAVAVAVKIGNGFTPQGLVLIAMVHFLVLAFLIYTLGDASGGHFNPAVTLGLLSVRKIGVKDALPYIALQLLGAILAGALAKGLLPAALTVKSMGGSLGEAAVSPNLGFNAPSALKALAIEFIGAFVLMWAIMGVAVNPRGRDEFAGLIIGGTLGFLEMVFAPLTGGAFNPARALGPNLWGHFGPIGTWLLVYVVGAILGAVAASQAYRALVLVPQEKLPADTPVDLLG